MTRIALIASALVGLTGCWDSEFSNRRAQLEEIAGHLASAYDRFDAHDYDGCIALCQLILSKNPEYTVAQELAEDAAKAFDRFDARDFDACIACCAWVLTREPEYCVAIEMAEDAKKVKGREEYYDFLRAKVENWKKLTSTGDEAEVPYTETLTYPHLAGFLTSD
jgi:hypothetical protein